MGRPWSPPTHHQQIKKASGFGHTHTHTHARTNHTLTHVRAAPHYSCVVSSVMCSDSTGTGQTLTTAAQASCLQCVWSFSSILTLLRLSSSRADPDARYRCTACTCAAVVCTTFIHTLVAVMLRVLARYPEELAQPHRMGHVSRSRAQHRLVLAQISMAFGSSAT